MKPLALLVAILFLSVACKEEEVASYDDLTQEEREAIQRRSYEQCKKNNQPIYNRFKTRSAEVFDSSSYNRENGFRFEYKKGSAEASITADIRVWKRDGNADEIYFYITETKLGTESYFLRMTRGQNEEIIDDLLEDHCFKPLVYTSTTGDNGPLNIKYEYNKSNAPNTDEYIDTYNLSFGQLAFFANYKLNRTVTTVNSDDENVGSPVKYTSTLTSKGFDFDDDASDWRHPNYNQRFCSVDYESGTKYRLSKDMNNLGFKLTCTDGTPPAGWNLSL